MKTAEQLVEASADGRGWRKIEARSSIVTLANLLYEVPGGTEEFVLETLRRTWKAFALEFDIALGDEDYGKDE